MSDAHKGLGRLPAPDDRDRQFTMREMLMDKEVKPVAPYKYYISGPVLDQGPYPMCVGYAWRQWLSSAILMTKGGPDAATIYREAQKVDEWPGEDYGGTSVRAGAKVLDRYGHVEKYLWAWNAQTVFDWLLGGLGTVVLGTNWYEGMNTPENGIMRPTGRILGGHAYLLVGANRITGLVRVLNSWGPEWSQRGRAWLSGESLERLLSEQGEACTATEKNV